MKLLKVLLASFVLLVSAFADREVKLIWDLNDPEEEVTSYVVFVNGVAQAPVATNKASVIIPDSRTVLTVIAVNSVGMKSDPSDPLTIPISPKNPKGIRISEIIRTTISTPAAP